MWVWITDAGGTSDCDHQPRRKVVKEILSQEQRIDEMAFRWKVVKEILSQEQRIDETAFRRVWARGGGAGSGRPEGFSAHLPVNRPTGNYVEESGGFTLFGGHPKEKNVEGIRLAT
jgi:hypothetical protein